jgi:DNA-damage-inducible protein D
METELIVQLQKTFEEHVHNEDGVEFWYARELQALLGYDEWRNFEKVIDKAKIACKSSKQEPSDHFVDVNKMVKLGSQAGREISDIKLTRYACYLIAQNGDPRKDEIAFAMTYFAVQTRKQEILEKRFAELDRVQAREKLSATEKELSGILFERGVDGKGFANIRSKGDAALFGGKNTQQMKSKLGVPEKRALADFLPSVTIKAKDLATEITNVNIKKNSRMKRELDISSEHIKNNKDVRSLLAKNDIIPEDLPVAEDVKKVQRRLNSEGKKLSKGTKKLKG